jgi:hypothetical protein
MSRLTCHIIIPGALSLVFFVIALSPGQMLGCRNRGLLVLLISLICGISALGTAIIGTKGRIRGDSNSIWWVISTLILIVPIVALVVLA